MPIIAHSSHQLSADKAFWSLLYSYTVTHQVGTAPFIKDFAGLQNRAKLLALVQLTKDLWHLHVSHVYLHWGGSVLKYHMQGTIAWDRS